MVPNLNPNTFSKLNGQVFFDTAKISPSQTSSLKPQGKKRITLDIDGTSYFDDGINKALIPIMLWCKIKKIPLIFVTARNLRETLSLLHARNGECQTISFFIAELEKYGLEVLPENIIARYEPLKKNYYVCKIVAFEQILIDLVQRNSEQLKAAWNCGSDEKRVELLRQVFEGNDDYKSLQAMVVEEKLGIEKAVLDKGNKEVTYEELNRHKNLQLHHVIKNIFQKESYIEIYHLDDRQDIIEGLNKMKEDFKEDKNNKFLQQITGVHYAKNDSDKKWQKVLADAIGLEAAALQFCTDTMQSAELSSLEKFVIITYLSQNAARFQLRGASFEIKKIAQNFFNTEKFDFFNDPVVNERLKKFYLEQTQTAPELFDFFKSKKSSFVAITPVRLPAQEEKSAPSNNS